jgi:Flp pilus assembly protein TadD
MQGKHPPATKGMAAALQGAINMMLLRLGALAGALMMCLTVVYAGTPTSTERLEILWKRVDDQCNAGKLDEALQTAQEAVKLAPDNGEAWAVLGWVQLQAGQWDESEKSYRKAVRLGPTSGHAYHGLGMVLYERGRLAEAESVLSEGVKADPTHAPLHCALGFLAAVDDRREEALSHLNEGLLRATDDGTRAEVRNLMGYEYAYRGDLAEAIRQVRLAISLHPRDPYFRDSLAALAALNGQYVEAEAQARKTLATAGAPTTTRAVLAYCLAAQDRPKEARAELGRILDDMSPTGDGVDFDLVYCAIRAYMELGDRTQAKLLYVPLAARYPKHPWLTALRAEMDAIK